MKDYFKRLELLDDIFWPKENLCFFLQNIDSIILVLNFNVIENKLMVNKI